MQDTRRDHDDVAPGEQRVGRRVPQPLDLVVDRGVLLDVGVRLRDVRLGLVVVVVGDEVLDRVVGQQLAELVGQLRGQRLVRAPSPASGAAPARSARPWSRTCRCRWRRAARRPSRRPGSARSRSAIAAGWSPLGWKSETTSNGATRALQVGRRSHGITVSAATDSLIPGRSSRAAGTRRTNGVLSPARSASVDAFGAAASRRLTAAYSAAGPASAAASRAAASAVLPAGRVERAGRGS